MQALKTACFVVVLIIFTSKLSYSFCFEQAGAHYGINPLLLWAIAKVESGFNPYALNKNSNGTYDIGLMQINSSWISVLKKYGLLNSSQLWEPCYNTYVGAWVLAQCIKKYGYNWKAVGCYNASSEHKRNKYAWKVYKVIQTYTQ